MMFPVETRFLIVDDFKTARMVLRRALSDLGFLNVHEAANGEEAWAALHQCSMAGQAVDVVLSDWNMPIMNGLELLTTIRSDSSYENLPFIMITAEGGHTQITEARELGVSDIVPKPYDSTNLSVSLERVYRLTSTLSL